MMIPETDARAAELFEAALDVAPEERAAFLARACGGDDRLRMRVERLLATDAEAGEFLEPATSASASVVITRPRDPLIGMRIGHYRVVGVIASGGMGTVYEAEQDEPKRRVALKVIRADVATESILRRFAHEAEILARLRHPGIAQVYEASTHAGNLPYFAMEFIPGARSITRFADEQRLSMRQRLELFIKVCDAVHHGHQRGIIHRDLKPGNVLVDESGQPKVIDFGVARATDADMTIATLQTDVGQIIGTLRYMSPEQCGGDLAEIDVRCDVYALGVVLYELLTGAFPYEISSSQPYDAPRVIREVEPRRLSSIDRVLRGDVETIVLQALAKEKSRRYQSVQELAIDLRHFLRSEPITARPPSRTYQLAKFAQRNKGLVAGAAIALMTLIVGLVATSAAMFEAAAQRDQALSASRQAAAINKFLLDMLASVDPNFAPRPEVSVREVLDQAAWKLDADPFGDQPLVEAALRSTLGRTYLSLGLYGEARPHLQRALEIRRGCLGEDHPDVVAALSSLGELARVTADYATAEEHFRSALALRRRLLGEHHLDTAESLVNLATVLGEQGEYDAAEALYRQALATQRSLLGDEHPLIATTLNNLAAVLGRKGAVEDTVRLQREVLAMRRKLLPADDLGVAQALNNLGVILHGLQELDEAEALYRDALAVRRQRLGNEHPLVAYVLNNLGTLLVEKRDLDGAERFLREALAIRRKALGEAHPDVAVSIANLGSVLSKQRDYDAAEELLREAVVLVQRARGSEHADVAITRGKLAVLLYERGKFDEAEKEQRAALATLRTALGPDHAQVASSLHNLAFTLRQKGDYEAAATLLGEAAEIFHKNLGDGHAIVLTCTENQALMLFDLGRFDEAVARLRKVLDGLRGQCGDRHPRVAKCLHELGRALLASGEREEGAQYVRDALALRREVLAADDPALAESLLAVGGLELDGGRTVDLGAVEAVFREAVEICCCGRPAGHWSIAEAESWLGACLSQSGRYEEAEALLLASYAALDELGAEAGARVARRRCAAFLAAHYEAWGKGDAADRWRAEQARATHPEPQRPQGQDGFHPRQAPEGY